MCWLKQLAKEKMVVSQFSILLDNPEAVYLAGQNVTGKLVLVVAIDPESFESKFLLFDITTYFESTVLLKFYSHQHGMYWHYQCQIQPPEVLH